MKCNKKIKKNMKKLNHYPLNKYLNIYGNN